MKQLIVIEAEDLEKMIKQAVKEALSEKPIKEYVSNTLDIGGIELACEVTGLTKSTIYKLKMDGKIPVKKQGKKLYFSRKELTNWINSGQLSK